MFSIIPVHITAKIMYNGLVYNSSWRCIGLYGRINIGTHETHACYFSLSYQITKREVDQFKPGLTIPSCLVRLEWTGGEQVPPQRLRHRVTLKGAKFPAFFHIRYDPGILVGATYNALCSQSAVYKYHYLTAPLLISLLLLLWVQCTISM